jgi:hypothetical protein
LLLTVTHRGELGPPQESQLSDVLSLLQYRAQHTLSVVSAQLPHTEASAGGYGASCRPGPFEGGVLVGALGGVVSTVGVGVG